MSALRSGSSTSKVEFEGLQGSGSQSCVVVSFENLHLSPASSSGELHLEQCIALACEDGLNNVRREGCESASAGCQNEQREIGKEGKLVKCRSTTPTTNLPSPGDPELCSASRATTTETSSQTPKKADHSGIFVSSALTALVKLQRASTQNTASPQFHSFVQELGDLQTVIKVGLRLLHSILEGKVPSDLKGIYCFLHVAYFIVHALTGVDTLGLAPREFMEDLSIFRNCLSPVPLLQDSDEMSAQALLDQIISTVWEGFEGGLKWTAPESSLPDDILDYPDPGPAQPKPGKAQRVKKNSLRVYKTTPKAEPMDKGKGREVVGITGGSRLLKKTSNKSVATTIESIRQTWILKKFILALDELTRGQFEYLCLGTGDTVNNVIEQTGVIPDLPVEDNVKTCLQCGYYYYDKEIECYCFESCQFAISNSRLVEVAWLHTEIGLVASRTRGQIFTTRKPSAKLLLRPERPQKFRCSEEGCEAKYVSKQGLSRHMAGRHDPDAIRKRSVCGYQGCKTTRTQIHSEKYGHRDDNMRTHMINDHKFTKEQVAIWRRNFHGDGEFWEFP
ncbi:hypothetical protein TWF718_004531 [Orbilia javanica]|uniref:C2H2-type domain-containing protein n=1 Tax=Orbilia javanica TaxID=47235 RepID=A0AAN8RKY8_9PEZI